MNDKDSVKEILERARDTVADSSSVEFEFTERSGVIFETEDSAKDTESMVAADEERGEAAAEQTEGTVFEETSSAEEFVLPDIFDIEEESEELLREQAAGVFTTYVPRFTEVSENYRMRRGNVEESGVRVSRDAEDNTVSIDPTAETEGNADNLKIINVEAEKGASEETKTVYKFASGKEDTPKIKVRTLEDEVREIDELMNVGEQEQSAARIEETAVTETTAEKAPEESIYSIPDSAVREANKESVSAGRESAGTAVEPVGAMLPKHRTEFSAPPQRDGFKDRFLDQLLSIKVRLAVAGVLTVLILLFENFNLFGVDIFATLRIPKYTGIPALLDLQLAACVFVLALPEIINAIVQLFRGKVSSEISVILSFIVILVYSITVFSLKLSEYALFGFLFAVHIDAAIFASYLRRSTDFSSFKLISGKENKRALVITPTRDMPHENIALDGVVDEYKSNTVRVVRTAFVSDFFKRCGAAAESTVATLIMMGISVGAAVVCGVVAFFLDDGFSSLVTSSSLVFLMAMPAFSVLTNKFIYSHAAAISKKEGCAIIGQGALAEYADADVIVFDDVEIFGEDDVKLRNFSGDMTKGMRQMCAIFSAVGGPLEKIFSSALDRKFSPATDVVIEKDGISGVVDGHRILAGGEAYMKRHGAEFEKSSIAFNAANDATKIMYAAEDGVIYAGFRISYSFSEGFTMILPSLKEAKIVPLVTTRDPNITNELIKTLTMGGDAIRVLKRSDVLPHTEKIEQRVGAGIVTSSDKSSALYAMLLCKRSAALSSRLAITEIMALAVGAALGVALSLGGMTSAPTVALGLWQLIWCVGVGFLSYKELKGE